MPPTLRSVLKARKIRGQEEFPAGFRTLYPSRPISRRKLLNALQSFRRPLRTPQIIILLQIKPKLRRRVESDRQTQRHLRRDRSPLIHQFGYRLPRHANRLGQSHRRKAQRLKVQTPKNPAGMCRRSMSFLIVFLHLIQRVIDKVTLSQKKMRHSNAVSYHSFFHLIPGLGSIAGD